MVAARGEGVCAGVIVSILTQPVVADVSCCQPSGSRWRAPPVVSLVLQLPVLAPQVGSELHRGSSNEPWPELGVSVVHAEMYSHVQTCRPLDAARHLGQLI